MPSVKADMTGRKYGKLTPIRPTGDRKDGSVVWECMCDCGNKCLRSQAAIGKGQTTSCGCARKAILAGGRPTHNLSHARTFRIWASIKRRCLNPHCAEYKYYGAKGIKICDQWRESFQVFIGDMGLCPDGLQIDRKDNSLGYQPGNCRWVTPRVQQNNRTNNHRIDGGKTITERARELGIRPGTVYERIRRGKSVEEALR